jgi:hypothetical protein
MCAIWQPETFEFAEFEDWEDWATENEEIVNSIRAGSFVPINVGGDGVFQVIVRWNNGAQLTEAERRCLVASSAPYLFISKGSFALGGLEDVGDAEFASTNQVMVDVGRYTVRIHLIDWKLDPESVAPSGKPTPTALPDFVVLLSEDEGGPYRTEIQSFERP